MEQDKKRYFITMSIVNAVLLGIASGIYYLTPFKILLWPMFIALGLTFAAGCDLKKTKNYLSCIYVGVLWGLLYIKMDDIFRSLGLGDAMNVGVATFLITAIVLLAHCVILHKTWLNIAYFAFAGLTVTTSQWGANILPILISMTCGVLIGVFTDPVTFWLLRCFKKKRNI